MCLVPFLLKAQIKVSYTFDHDSVCSGTPVKFTSKVLSDNTSPKFFTWNFGDGFTSKVANPVHTFDPFGCGINKFLVRLTVTDTTGGISRSDSYDSTVYVVRRPNPQLTDLANDIDFSNCDNSPTPETAVFPVRVQNNTFFTECILSYTLDWGDGSPLLTSLQMSNFPIDHTYAKLGAFNLTITALAANGCNGKTVYVVKNQSNPAVGLASGGGTGGCAPQTYSFTIANDTLNSPGTTYLWNFGDNSPQILWTRDSVLVNNRKILHTFTTNSCGRANNEFITTVTASNSCSSTSATIGSIKMWSPPEANFEISPPLGCENSKLFCFNNTTVPGAYGSNCDPSTTYLWDFGKGITSTAKNPPCRIYPESGPQPVTLTATNKCSSTTITKQAEVQKLPVAAAEADTNSGCVPFTVKFTNKSTDTTKLQYYWSVNQSEGWRFSNNSYSNTKDPELEFTKAGTYIVDLEAFNSCGNSHTTIAITARDIPSVALPIIADECFPFTYSGNASYLNNGNTISSYQWSVNPASGWSFISPSNSGSQNPQILFSQAGKYNITVKATNACGTGDSISNRFEIQTPLQVTVGNDTTVCINSGGFKMAAFPSGGTWSGNNVSSTGIFSPLVSGDFTLTYSLGSGTCLRQDQVLVRVLQIPVVNAGADMEVCVNHGTITLTGSPVGGTWSGTGITSGAPGVFDPLITVPGIFPVTYSYTDPSSKCANSDVLLITVMPYPDVKAEDVTLCNQPIPEQLNASPAGGTWSGPNVSPDGIFTPNAIGNFDLNYTFIDINGCSGSDPMRVTVIKPDTTVSAGNDMSICSSESITLTGNPLSGTWTGTYISQGGFFDPLMAGDYKLVYSTGTGSCFRADTTLVTVRPSPKADFTASTVCFGETTVFDDRSQGGGANIASWLWEFGDNGYSRFQHARHNYLAPGTYQARLMVQNSSNCTDTIVKPVEVLKLPVVDFNFSLPACTGVPVNFINHSSNAQSYFWEFGDGNTSSQFEPAHIFTTEGSYKVRLRATTGSGCHYSDSSLITITGPPPKPVFQLSVKEGCSPLTVRITIDPAHYNLGSSYNWDFGNGIISNVLTPPDSLTFTGSLTGDTVIYIRFASFNACNYFVFSDSVLVHAKPLSRFEMLHEWDCSPVEVLLRNVSTGFPHSLYWDFGDGMSSTETEPLHTYTTGSGSTVYHISLVARNGCGSDTITKDLLVKPKTVHAYFTVGNFKGCEGDPFCFRNYSTDASKLGISNISWNFGDGHGSSDENPCHIFSNAGTYIAKLTVYNGCGYDDTSDTIEIMPVPHIAVSSRNNACAGDPVSFSYTSDVEIAGKVWYFGDGDSSILSNPNHAYRHGGNYQVLLKGTSAFGFPACVGTADKQLLIYPTPEASILPDTSGCVPLQITFRGDPGSLHLWNFGDNSAVSSNPTHVYNSPGVFMVKLVSENNSGCMDSDSIPITVLPSPVSRFTYTTSGGYPEYLAFTNTSVGTTACYWDFGNGRETTVCAPGELVEYSRNDSYTITLVTQNQLGCADTASALFTTSFKGLFVPNALIPEHPDPDENLFLPKGIGLVEYTIQIFDTWGNLIWQSSALQDGMPAEGWNGRDAGGRLYPQDVYAWRATAKFIDGTYWSGKNGKNYGTVTLIR